MYVPYSCIYVGAVGCVRHIDTIYWKHSCETRCCVSLHISSTKEAGKNPALAESASRYPSHQSASVLSVTTRTSPSYVEIHTQTHSAL